MLLLYSFGDGVQYPVQLSHLPEHTVNQITGTNYESMGTTQFPAINADDAANETQQSVIGHKDAPENGNSSRYTESDLNLMHTNGSVQGQPLLNAIVVDSNKSRNGSVAIDIVHV